MPSEARTGLAEERRNALLRTVDWRFLLGRPDAPSTTTSGASTEAVRLISSGPAADPGAAELAVIGFPTRSALRAAGDALTPGGDLVCVWRVPRPGGARAARRRLEAAGFGSVRVYWPGPLPNRAPQFWLPLDSPAAIRHLLAERPARTRTQAGLRRAWRWAARAGMLAPLCAIARAPGGSDPEEEAGLLLLTGGGRSINKVVGLEFADDGGPRRALKFARVPEAEPGLEREAAVLGSLTGTRPELGGFPRLEGKLRRAGMFGVAETPLGGDALLEALTESTFGDLAMRVTAFLIELAGSEGPVPESLWRERLVAEPLDGFERRFGSVVGAATIERVRARLNRLGDMPVVCEHRDCSPWNTILGPDGSPALFDWESAEPEGLPGLDLVYFLANSAFILDRALEAGTTRQSYAALLDPATAHGRVAAECLSHYGAAVGLDADVLARLRLLCWVIHTRSDHRHLELEVGGTPRPEDLRRAPFLGLIEEELKAGDAEHGGRR